MGGCDARNRAAGEPNPPQGRVTSQVLVDHDPDATLDKAATSRKQDQQNLHFCKVVEALQLNHEGVLLLKCGDQEEKAIWCLRKSLGRFQLDMVAAQAFHYDRPSLLSSSGQSANENVQDLTNSQERRIQSAQFHPPHFFHDHDFLNPSILPVQIHEPTSVDDFFYVCTKAFIIQPPPSLENKQESHFGSAAPPIIDTQLLRATVMYNLALTLHLKGLQSKCRTLQQQALSLYATSYRILHNSLLELPPNPANDSNQEDKNGNTSKNRLETSNNFQAEATSYIIGSLLMACCFQQHGALSLPSSR